MKDCSNCKHTAKNPFEQPCASCIAVGGRACWEPMNAADKVENHSGVATGHFSKRALRAIESIGGLNSGGRIFKSTVVMCLYMCIQLLETENDKELILTLIDALSREELELECGKANAAPPASNENLSLWPFPGVDGGVKP